MNNTSGKPIVAEWFDRKFRLADLEIFRTRHWVVSLRPRQTTVGSLVCALVRPSAVLGEVTPNEWADFAVAVRTVESLLSKSLKPERINYLALMMIDPHVHFHVIPRYESARRVGATEFADRDWPGPPGLNSLEGFGEAHEQTLVAMLREAAADVKQE